MTDTSSHPFVATLRSGLRWLKSFEDAMDFSMDEVLLGRIETLEKVVATLESRIDGLCAERGPLPNPDAVGALTAGRLGAH